MIPRIPVSVPTPIPTVGVEPYRIRNYRHLTNTTDFQLIFECKNYQQFQFHGMRCEIIAIGSSNVKRGIDYYHRRDGVTLMHAATPPLRRGSLAELFVSPEIGNWDQDEAAYGRCVYSRQVPSMMLPGDTLELWIAGDGNDTHQIDIWWSEAL